MVSKKNCKRRKEIKKSKRKKTTQMPSQYYRALATCSFLKRQLEHEQVARKAMELCVSKIRKMLDLYKGHLINRIRFHIDNHQDEYCRYSGAPSFDPHTPMTTCTGRCGPRIARNEPKRNHSPIPLANPSARKPTNSRTSRNCSASWSKGTPRSTSSANSSMHPRIEDRPESLPYKRYAHKHARCNANSSYACCTASRLHSAKSQ